MNFTIRILLFAFVLFLLSSCKKEDGGDSRKKVPDTINPSTQPDALNQSLVIYGLRKSGQIPATINPSSVNVTFTVPSALITKNNFLFLPFAFHAQDKLKGIYVQVDGANEYWDVPLNSVTAQDSSLAIAIGVPDFILDGAFKLSYKLYDNNGNVGAMNTIDVKIAPLENSCGLSQGVPRVEGKDGITIKTFDLGDKAGQVEISYYMYTQKDRMDIRYHGKWIRSTAPVLLAEGQAPPYKTCDIAQPADGFVSDGGTFTIDYNPVAGREVSIYVSGCLQGGTLWYFDVRCPDNTGATPNVICDYGSAQDYYDKTNSNYHHYPKEGADLTTVICDTKTDPNCNKQNVFEAMLKQSRFIAPTADQTPVMDCKVTLADILFYKNPVVTKVNAAGFSITNYTIINWKAPNGVVYSHKLHPGKVTRTIREINGKIVVQTEGEGTGSYPSLNQNEWISESVWLSKVDSKLKEFWDQQ